MIVDVCLQLMGFLESSEIIIPLIFLRKMKIINQRHCGEGELCGIETNIMLSKGMKGKEKLEDENCSKNYC